MSERQHQAQNPVPKQDCHSQVIQEIQLRSKLSAKNTWLKIKVGPNQINTNIQIRKERREVPESGDSD